MPRGPEVPARAWGELERARGKSQRRPEDAIKRVDVRLERITELYAMGHWEKDRYVQERARLEADRRDLEDLEEPERTLKLDRADAGPFRTRGDLAHGARPGHRGRARPSRSRRRRAVRPGRDARRCRRSGGPP